MRSLFLQAAPDNYHFACAGRFQIFGFWRFGERPLRFYTAFDVFPQYFRSPIDYVLSLFTFDPAAGEADKVSGPESSAVIAEGQNGRIYVFPLHLSQHPFNYPHKVVSRKCHILFRIQLIPERSYKAPACIGMVGKEVPLSVVLISYHKRFYTVA